ncbi:hypothetical protein [Verrucomicrobium sp. BvORR034]|uniref:hypothetical protein n=1 Tax=Verrucomicrobium sp. BvORR034 TaxID=1396418 RepID=UPI000678F4DE|nr:hypothetical protein [Verrucomicrobium sp. BvORR034]
MRGFPPLHLLLFAIAFGLVAVPLSHLTFARPAVVQPQTGKPAAIPDGIHTYLRLRFAHVPEKVSVRLGDQLLMDEKTAAPAATMTTEASLVIPKEGLELLVQATWPIGTPSTAITLELEPDEKEARSQTHWTADSAFSQIYSFVW